MNENFQILKQEWEKKYSLAKSEKEKNIALNVLKKISNTLGEDLNLPFSPVADLPSEDDFIPVPSKPIKTTDDFIPVPLSNVTPLPVSEFESQLMVTAENSPMEVVDVDLDTCDKNSNHYKNHLFFQSRIKSEFADMY